MAIAEKAKKRYQEARAEVNQIREQAKQREAKLQQLLDAWMAKHKQALQDLEEKVTTTLQAANAESATKFHDMEAHGALTLRAAITDMTTTLPKRRP